MALTSHHRVHPVRRTVGLVLVVAIVVVLLVKTWNQNRLADRIEESFRGWLEPAGQPSTRGR
ncbi:MAG: hypothetical protein HKN62_07425 [Phycisphaerales bacterium]|nr:hypothetical protein [Phycisphaerales bacterium]